MAHPMNVPFPQPDDDADRRNRFASVNGLDSAGPASLRERAASQPPRTSSQNFLSSHQTISPTLSRGNPPWAQRPPPTFNPGSFPGRSSSFSTTAPTLQTSLSAMREARAFASTFEDDESEATSDTYDERFLPSSMRGRSYAADLTRSRSQSLVTRPGALGSNVGQPGHGVWNDSGFGSNPLSIPGRIAETKTFASNRYGYFGTSLKSSFDDRFLPSPISPDLNLRSSPYSSHPADISNMSPFVRNVNDILLDDGSAFRELWSGTGMHDNTNGGGSGTTSRRHSVSVVQPRRGIVGFSAPGIGADDEPTRTPGQVFGQSSLGRGGLLLSDDDLASDLNMLSLGKDGPGPVSSSSGLPPSQPSSLPIYAPLSRSPERFSPYQNLNLTIPGGRQALGEPNDSGLSSGGSPSIGHPDFQDPVPQNQHTLTARFIPGQGIKYISQPTNNDGGFATRSPISPRASSLQQQPHAESYGLLSNPIQRRSSDAHSQLPQPRQSINDIGKGVPLHAVPASCPLYIVEFKAGRTDLFYATDLSMDIRVGDLVIVEADRGKDLGKVVNDTITLAEVDAFQRQQQQQQSSHVGYGDTPTTPGEQAPLSAGGAGSKKEINPKMIYGKAGTQDAQYVLGHTYVLLVREAHIFLKALGG